MSPASALAHPSSTSRQAIRLVIALVAVIIAAAAALAFALNSQAASRKHAAAALGLVRDPHTHRWACVRITTATSHARVHAVVPGGPHH